MNENIWLVLLLSPRHPALSNLPGVHRQAIEATMNEVSQPCPLASGWSNVATVYQCCSTLPSLLPPATSVG